MQGNTGQERFIDTGSLNGGSQTGFANPEIDAGEAWRENTGERSAPRAAADDCEGAS
jgi:hypothetical protein